MALTHMDMGRQTLDGMQTEVFVLSVRKGGGRDEYGWRVEWRKQ